jgi:hypothetical protein
MIHEVLKELGPKTLNRIYGQSSHRQIFALLFVLISRVVEVRGTRGRGYSVTSSSYW